MVIKRSNDATDHVVTTLYIVIRLSSHTETLSSVVVRTRSLSSHQGHSETRILFTQVYSYGPVRHTLRRHRSQGRWELLSSLSPDESLRAGRLIDWRGLLSA